MKKDFDMLVNYIKEEKRNEAIKLAIKILEDKEITLVELYENILAKTLQSIDCDPFDRACIWKEHIQTSIVRGIIEIAYPYVLREFESVEHKNKSVLIVCPQEEYHEIGAKMAHDLFMLAGYDTTFIGANTPKDVIMDAVNFVKPDYVAISATNFYNLVNVKQVISQIKELHNDIKIIAGGQAFNTEGAHDIIKADYYLSSFASIKELN
jgi:methanogenic corrinoid protein MtbC1